MATFNGGQIDQAMMFSNAQAVTGAAISDNIIDLSAVRELGNGPRPLYLVSIVTTTFTDSGDNSNMTVKLQTDSVSAFNSATNTQTLGVFATNTAAGSYLVAQVGPFNAGEQYLGVYYDVGNGNFTAAAVTTFLTPDITAWVPTAKGYTGPTTA